MANTKLIKANKHPPIINIIVIDEVRAASGKLELFVGLDGIGNCGLRDGSMDGGVDGCLDGGVDGTADGCLDGCADGGVDGTADGCLDGCADGGVDGTADGCLDGCADGLAVQISPLVHVFFAVSGHSEILQQLNKVARENIESKSVPFDTSHCEMSLLNEVAP